MALPLSGWTIFLLLLAAYLGVWYALRSRGPLKGGFEFTGPLLLWRTQFGKRAIERVSRAPRFWNAIADVGIMLTWFVGFCIFALLVLSLYQYIATPREVAANAPPVEFLIGLPGVNPLIPVGYGILALVIALVIHEGSHGVMAYVGKLRVKSLGLVFFIVPVGAFVEPHEEDLMKASARVKNRVFAAGPTSNIVLALVAGLVLSTAFVGQLSVANDGEGVVVGGIEEGSAADTAGLQTGDLLIRLDAITLYPANATGNATENATENATASGSTTSIALVNRSVYSEALAQTRAGDNLTLTYQRDGERFQATTTLGDRYDYIARVAPEQNSEENRGKGFLGVSGVGLDNVENIRDALARPFGSVGSFFFYLAYPFFIFTQGLDVLADPYQQLFEIHGPFAFLPAPVFFGIATLLFWIVWLNLMLGTFNALPAGPLDGGQMLRATLSDRLMKRYRVDPDQLEVQRQEMGGLTLRGKDEETQRKLDKVNLTVGRAVKTLGFFILGLILLPVFAPPLIRLFG